MRKYNTDSIRSVAFVGHGASGKTTLTEGLLVKAGAISVPGRLEAGDTVSDFDPLERSWGHSLNASLVNFAWRGIHVHLIDTPGYPDFSGQAISALAGVDTAVIVINAQAGIEFNTVRMMRYAAARGLCRMILINKIDAPFVDLPGLLTSIQERFGKECLPINLPARRGTRVVDCFFNPEGESDFSSVAAAHQALVDQVVEVDADLMAEYLEKGEVAPGDLHAPFEKALREGHLVPVCFASARNGAGLEELLDIFAKLAPNPTEGNAPPFLRGEGDEAEEFHAEPDPNKHVLAHVFKVTIDPYVGKLGIFRVHQGTITKDSQLFVGDGRKPFKAGHLFVMQGKDHVETDVLVPGDIGAVAKVDEIVFDAVLHDSHEEDHIHLRPLEFPRPMQGIAVSARKQGDDLRLFDVMHKLELEDPCFRVERDAVTHDTVMRGLGDLHLRSKLEKMQKQHKLEVTTAPPKVAYRETITLPAEGHCRHKKQTGGAGQFGEVYLRVEPLPRGSGFEFVDEVKGGVIPGVYIPAVEKGVRTALESGIVAGYPVEDLRVVVYDGKHHPVDSKEVAFVSAGRKAMRDALSRAGCIVLEPIVHVEVQTPVACIGDLTSDLSTKRGHITGTEARGAGIVAITGQVPVSELTEYPSRLRSITGGHGSFSIEYSHYAPVPALTQQQLASKHKVAHEED